MPSWFTLDRVASVLAIGLAAWALFRGSATDRRIAAIEQERRQEEVASRGRADLTARIEKEQVSGRQISSQYMLAIENRGEAPAREVIIESPAAGLVDGDDGRYSLALVDAHQALRLQMFVVVDTPPKFEVKLSWLDTSGINEKVILVTLW